MSTPTLRPSAPEGEDGGTIVPPGESPARGKGNGPEQRLTERSLGEREG
jgi:hypothetical protein